MTVFHHAIKSMGTRYDPLAGRVVAHIVGGGSVGNTQFKDLSANNTPCVTVGGLVGGSTFGGPLGPIIGLFNQGGASALTLSPPDNRFSTQSGDPLSSTFTVDGWFRANLSASNSTRYILTAHKVGYVGADWYYSAPGGMVFSLSHNGTLSDSNLSLYVARYHSDGLGGGSTYATPVLTTQMGAVANNSWIYFHLVVTPGGTGTLTVHGRAPTTGSVYGYWDYGDTLQALTLGGPPNGAAASALGGFYAMRITKGVRPYVASVGTGPWPTQGGTTNWLGAPAGASTPVGQRVLGNGEVWVVPQGISHISAVAVGCKLSIAGTDVLAATWPVLGDGGGQGGAGGTGHSSTVVIWSNGPPAPGGAFGGTPGTVRSEQTYTYYGGGGGAGGYTGNGGNGVSTQGSTASAGQGGGGGGGATQAWGGGVGLKGQGASGTGGFNPGQPGSANGTTYGGGKPGNGGTVNGSPGNHLAWRNNIPVTQGQVVLCTYIGQSGQTGAARLMWGDARSYPNNAGEVE